MILGPVFEAPTVVAGFDDVAVVSDAQRRRLPLCYGEAGAPYRSYYSRNLAPVVELCTPSSFGRLDEVRVSYFLSDARSTSANLPGSEMAGTFTRPIRMSSISALTWVMTAGGMVFSSSGFMARAPMPPAMPTA